MVTWSNVQVRIVMTLPLSGTISMSEIDVELSYPATQILSLGQTDARQLADVPAGVISLSDFYGKSNIVGAAYFMGGNIDFPVNTPLTALSTATQFVFSTETGSILPGVTAPSGPFFNLNPPGVSNVRSGAMTSSKAAYISHNNPTTISAPDYLMKFDFRTQTYGLNVITNPIQPYVDPSYPNAIVLPLTGNSLNTENESYSAVPVPKASVPNPTGAPLTRGWLKFTFTTEAMAWQNANCQYGGSPSYLNSSGQAQAFNGQTKYGKGYLTGGTAPPSGFPVSNNTSIAFLFSNGTTYFTNMGLTLSGVDYAGSGIQSLDNAYMRTGGGPSPAGYPTWIRSVNFSTETSNQFFQNLGYSRFQTASAFLVDTHGYFYGGTNNNANTPPASDILSEVAKFTFATETLAILPPTGTSPIVKAISTQTAPMY